ncbi:MAG: patatin family protein [Eubacterium sp.]|nr:patatin family protein [Eubacterium sp.]
MYKSGLVLEGGGLRAVYTSGVLDAFIENEIEFPYVIGVSMGTCNGVSFVGKNLHRMRDMSIGYASDERYMSLKSMLKNGEYLNSEWIFNELSYDMFPLDDETYESSGTVMCCVATNALTGKPEYFYPKSFRNSCPEIRASCALPLATRPVEIGGELYFDGGLVDSIPIERAYDDGVEKAVVILTQDRDFRKHPVGHYNAVKKILRQYPLIAERIHDRHDVYNNQRNFVFQQEKAGNAFVICPSEPLNCPTLERSSEKLQEIYDLGYKQGLDNIHALKEYLKDEDNVTKNN